MLTDKLYLEIVRQLEKRSNPRIASRQEQLSRRWDKKGGHKYHGIQNAKLGELIESYQDRLQRLSIEEKLDLARMFFESGFSEQANFGGTLLEPNVADMTPSHFDYLDEIASHLNNWGTTDWFCIRILQPLLRKYPKETLKLLRKWNPSRNMWKRRASVVTFTRKIGASGEFTSEALELCNNLIWDEEDLIRKAVGWALKDTMRGDKKRVLRYVKSLRRKGVSSTITLYAIRDLRGRERQRVLNIKPRKRILRPSNR